MSRLEDPEILASITEALEEAARGVNGYVSWKPIAWEWVAANLEGETQRSMAEHLLAYVKGGGKVDRVKETRGFDEHYHYDFRPHIANQHIYVETALRITKTGPTLNVVSVRQK